MKNKKKKTVSFDDLISGKASIDDATVLKTNRDILKEKYRNSLRDARGNVLDDKSSRSRYSLSSKIRNNPWVKNRPASQAHAWLYRTVFKDPGKYKYTKSLLHQGGLFSFEYKNPKYKDTDVLPFFDNYPLVLSLGPVVTNHGIRIIGFNLHLVPPAVRVVALCMIFEQHRRMYRYQIFSGRQNPVLINYKIIVNTLKKYGIKFCVRMYIPQRIRQVVSFPYDEWDKAVFIPSRGYYGIRASQLINAWQTFCRKENVGINPRIDWRSII